MADEKKIRPPRGALIVIAVGLLATIAAALLSTDKPLGAATLEWVEEAPLPDPKPVAIPGGGKMQLSNAAIRSTEPNAGEYTLFRSSALLTIDAGSAVGQGRLRCTIAVPQSGRSSPRRRRAAPPIPRSSEDLAEQEIHEHVAGRVQLPQHRPRRRSK